MLGMVDGCHMTGLESQLLGRVEATRETMLDSSVQIVLDMNTQFVLRARKGARNKYLAFRGHLPLVCEGRDSSMKGKREIIAAVSMKGKGLKVTVSMKGKREVIAALGGDVQDQEVPGGREGVHEVCRGE